MIEYLKKNVKEINVKETYILIGFIILRIQLIPSLPEGITGRNNPTYGISTLVLGIITAYYIHKFYANFSNKVRFKDFTPVLIWANMIQLGSCIPLGLPL